MARFVVTVKFGSNGASGVWRDVETGVVGAWHLLGPVESVQHWIKRVLEASGDVEIKYE